MVTMTFFPFLRDYLNSNLTIYTVRRFLYTPEVGMVVIPGVGGCKRSLVQKDVKKEDLDSYYKESGFDSTDSWWSKIQDINSKVGPVKLYLYKVVKVR